MKGAFVSASLDTPLQKGYCNSNAFQRRIWMERHVPALPAAWRPSRSLILEVFCVQYFEIAFFEINYALAFELAQCARQRGAVNCQIISHFLAREVYIKFIGALCFAAEKQKAQNLVAYAFLRQTQKVL